MALFSEKLSLESQDFISNQDFLPLFQELINCDSGNAILDTPNPYSTDLDPFILHYKDPLVKPNEQENELSYETEKLLVQGVPKQGAKSRVETQTKLSIQLKGVNLWSFIKINKDMLAKSKNRKLSRPTVSTALFSNETDVLNLEANVIHSDTDQPIRMCESCMLRERKRTERIKDERPKDESRERERILLFNCESLIPFTSGNVTLPIRITCYCRHHNEKVGFRIRFTANNNKGEIVATGTSPPIMITDDHKSIRSIDRPNRKKRIRQSTNDPISSFIWDSSLGSSIRHQKTFHEPRLDRIVPAQGPAFGGTEVTLIGSGFHQGLTCLFGDRPASIVTVYPNSIVCLLPPSQPGSVVVSFKEHVLESQDVAIFTYHDSSDRALLELALQLIGLKTTGKLQNAEHVAMDIVQGRQEHVFKKNKMIGLFPVQLE